MQYGNWRAMVLPSFGANLIDLNYRGRPILRTPNSMADLSQSPCLYGNPLLFPANRTRDGRFVLDEKEYVLPINEPDRHNHLHGQFSSAVFTVTEQTDTCLRCSYCNIGELFPIPFTIDIRFVLDGSGLTQSFWLGGDHALPVMFGLHTTFCEPPWFSVPIGERWECNDRFIPTGKLLPLNSYEQRYHTGCTPQGEAISGFYTASGQTARIGEIEYSMSKGFNQWVIYNGGGSSGYLCVEPQSAPVNGLNMKAACRIVPAGGRVGYHVRFKASRQV